MYEGTCWKCRFLEKSTNWRSDSINGSRCTIRCSKLYSQVNPYDKQCYRAEEEHSSDSYIQDCVEAFEKKCRY